ncbi:acyl-ACP--UDP-N-acetylglucosamine O-acyltransferase [Albimonas sp. CAU 1670]|uniref:acyl-ACP--UDP-N-acetylglucosamine O-acyltransferase n=1 Tax=Albimonas sp. CAU 1670 TaxID=3032599 RepID=UPI0023DAA46F|nr:acyl-ACP--UDP-N-acetylglucosamine O-acyltransferase [Albimonas sp. CAU 1670]MDF2231648.1 acyl-ACP--UDP-N-acetylglucosamine O-acyltransferase [Albimonas sp. CAU 1670]
MAVDPSARIHPTAIVEDGAEIGADVVVGPFCTVGPRVSLAAGVELRSHVVVEGRTSIGAGTRVWPFAVLGAQPQDLKYAGEDSRLEIGARNMIREHVTMNLGTEGGGYLTKIGDGCLFMASTHVGHDCIVGNGVIIANNAPLGGHVIVEDRAIIGGNAAVHQHSRIGRGAIVGGLTGVERDVIPYGSVTGDRARLAGLNLVGLRRAKADRAHITDLRACVDFIFDASAEGGVAARAQEAATRWTTPLAADVCRFMLAESSRHFVTPRD